MSNPAPNSYHLPDLLTLTREIPLRTNIHCRPITEASTAWLAALPTINLALDDLEKMKLGLLATLCYPTCDYSQLRIGMDVLSAVFLSSDQRNWRWNTTPGQVLAIDVKQVQNTGDLSLLEDHNILQHLIPSLHQHTSKMPTNWKNRFSRHLARWRYSQATLFSSTEMFQDEDEYIRLKIHASGFMVLFDMAEVVEGLHIPEAKEPDIEKMFEHVSTFLVLAVDTFAYNRSQLQDNDIHNVVRIVMQTQNVPLQHAISLTEARIRSSFEAFNLLEGQLSAPTPPSSPPPKATHSFVSRFWRPQRTPGSPQQDLIPSQTRDLRCCGQGLKDFIIGVINWAYETELYFGEKGEDVRAFGWVFMMTNEGQVQNE
ncbi:isoprenoid synthase domain-containing protein [Flagelloscypha sp. PMI_526]|nr:isoprenoid synthase domain-containing protein [Flagelloscypha sp. PMI_526]